MRFSARYATLPGHYFLSVITNLPKTSLSDCLEDILEYMKHKNPNVKLETLRFLIRCLRNTRDFPSKAESKLIAEASGKLLSDTTAPARDGAAEAMGTLMKILGERQMNPFLDGLDEIRKVKIKEFFEIAEVKAKEKPKPAAPPPAPKAPPAKKTLGGKPGLKKKAPAAPAPPPVEEPQRPMNPPRAIPSKLAAPRAGPGALKLQKKPPGASGVSALVSPKRVGAPRALSPEEEPPEPKVAFGGRGLASRPLSKEAAPPVRTVDAGLSALEKAELEELRAEKDRWAKQIQEEKAEKTRLLQEINDLQLQVSPFSKPQRCKDWLMLSIERSINRGKYS